MLDPQTLKKNIISDMRVELTSQVPYATTHNEGGPYTQNVRAHQRRRRGKAPNASS